MSQAYNNGDLVKFNGAKFIYHDSFYGLNSLHGLPNIPFEEFVEKTFQLGGLTVNYKGFADAKNFVYPYLFENSANLANMCHSCGHIGIAEGLGKAIQELQLPPWQIALSSGIGCGGKLSSQYKAVLPENYAASIPNEGAVAAILKDAGVSLTTVTYLEQLLNLNRYHVIHGHATSHAFGLAMTQPGLVNIVAGGDGDLGAIGLPYLKRLIQNNVNTLVIPMVNEVYGLTKGQPSPSTAKGLKGRAMPDAMDIMPIDFVLETLAIPESTYVARVIANNRKAMKEHFISGIMHNGTAIVDVLSPCVTWNTEHDGKYYELYAVDVNNFNWDDVQTQLKELGEEIERFQTAKSIQEGKVQDSKRLKLEVETRKYNLFHDLLQEERIEQYDPTNKDLAFKVERRLVEAGFCAIGLIYYNKDSVSYQDRKGLLPASPIGNLTTEQLTLSLDNLLSLEDIM